MAESKQSLYSYEPLNSSADCFRLLRLQRPSPDQNIHCTIRNAMTDATDYTALSYMWDPENTGAELVQKPIYLNNEVFKVGKNLWSFLDSAQHVFPETNFWVDAICINQVDTEERHHQVRRMHRIYSNASGVLIWLGEGDGSTQKVFDTVNQGDRWEKIVVYDYGHIFDPSSCELKDPEPEEDIILRKGIRKIFGNIYWTRQWIVQELLLAQKIEIMAGLQRMDWSSLFGPMDIQEHPGSLEHKAGGARMTMIREARDDPNGIGRPENLDSLILALGEQDCSDPRDHVYSLLGLANISDKFKVDYRCEFDQLVQYTLGFIDFSDYLFAPAVAQTLGISAQEALARFSAEFLDENFAGHSTSRFLNVNVKEDGVAETLTGAPKSWNLPSTGHPLVLSLCWCPNCRSKLIGLLPGKSYIVTEVPRTGLIILCRLINNTTSIKFVGCVGREWINDEFERGNEYQCFAADSNIEHQLRTLCATMRRLEGEDEDDYITCRLNWRTIFNISTYTHFGTRPGTVVLCGPQPHNMWYHS